MKSAASAQERHDRLMKTDEIDLENSPPTPTLRDDDTATQFASAATATSHHDDGNTELAEAEEGQATMRDSQVASQYEKMDADIKAFVRMNNSIPTPMPPVPDSIIEYAAMRNDDDDFGENVKIKKKRRKKKKHHKRNNRKGSEEVNKKESSVVSKSAFVNSYTATAASQHQRDGTSTAATLDSTHPTGNAVQQQKPSSTTIREDSSSVVSKSAFVASYAATATAASQHQGDGTSTAATLDSTHPTGNAVQQQKPSSTTIREDSSSVVSKSAFVASYAATATAASQHQGDGTSATASVNSRQLTGNTVHEQKPSATILSPQEVSPTVPQVSLARGRSSQPQHQPPTTSQASLVPRDPSSLSLSLSRIDEEIKPPEVEATLVQSVEATLILNDNQNNTVTDNRPVYVATRVSSIMSISLDGTRSWWKKYKAYIALGLGSLALGAMGATIGMLASDNGDARDYSGDNSGSGGTTTNIFLGGIGNVTGPPTSSTSAPATGPPTSSTSALTTTSPLSDSTTTTNSSPSPTTTLANETRTNTTMAELDDTVIPPSVFPLPSPDESESPTFRPPSTSAPTFKIDSTTSADPTHSPAEWVGSTARPSVSPSTLKPTNQAITSIPNDQTTTTATLSTFDTMAPGTREFQFSYGCVFNVRTKPNVNDGTVLFTGFDFYTQSTANVTFELWTRSGTFKGYKGNFEGWDLIAKGTTMGRGVEGGFTPIPADTYTPVSITKGGNIRAFYLTLDTPELLYSLGNGVESDGTAPETTVSDAKFHAETDDLEIWEGEGVLRYPFPNPVEYYYYRIPRQYVGAIHYTIVSQ